MGIVGRLLGWKPHAPDRLRVTDVLYFLDGGTTEIRGRGRWRRWSITLTQHMFEGGDSFGPPGRLYLGGYLVPMRSELERDIVALLRRCVAELREPPPARPASPAGAAEPGRGGRAILFGSPELAELYRMSPEQQNVRHLERVIAYVESDGYGKVTGTE